MISPLTGKEMKVQIEPRTINYRKESFTIKFHTYLCEDSGKQFENEKFVSINYIQVLNQYRAKYNLPFTHEIIDLRKRFGLSASKMSDILGFGVNTYRNYENGEIPSTSNSRLLQLAFDSKEFLQLATISKALSDKDLKLLGNRLQERDNATKSINKCLSFLTTGLPNSYNGYKTFNFLKTAALIDRIINNTETFKTKLNKLLFYIDFNHYRHYGNSITGLQYNAIPWGPVPNNFDFVFAHLVQLKYMRGEYIVFDSGYEGERYLPADLKNSILAPLTDTELASTDFVLKTIGDYSSVMLSDVSHNETGWIDNEVDKSAINYEYSYELKAI